MKTSFNISKLLQMWIPEILRKPKTIAWMKVQARPIVTMYADFMNYIDKKRYEATITGDTIRLIKALQDRYGNEGIYIIQPTDYLDEAWFFLKNEPQFSEWDFLSTENDAEYDYLASEFDPNYDFIIRVPVALTASVADMKAFLKKYIMASKRYNIEFY